MSLIGMVHNQLLVQKSWNNRCLLVERNPQLRIVSYICLARLPLSNSHQSMIRFLAKLASLLLLLRCIGYRHAITFSGIEPLYVAQLPILTLWWTKDLLIFDYLLLLIILLFWNRLLIGDYHINSLLMFYNIGGNLCISFSWGPKSAVWR